MESLNERCGDIVLPGDVVCVLERTATATSVTPPPPPSHVFVGCGLKRRKLRHRSSNASQSAAHATSSSLSSNSSSVAIVATCAGVLRHAPLSNRMVNEARAPLPAADEQRRVYYVDFDRQRYVAKKHDIVIGIVTERYGDAYKVDVGAARAATLNALAFEGATRKAKPDLKVGALVCARVLNSECATDTQLSCVSVREKADGLGPLDAATGALLNVRSCAASTALAMAHNRLLTQMSAVLPFEIAAGCNARVWVRASSARRTAAVAATLQRATRMESKQGIQRLISTMLEPVAGLEGDDSDTESDANAPPRTASGGDDDDAYARRRNANVMPSSIRKLID